MHIQKITIKNFRCFEHLEVNLDPDINIFVGNNGSGKSALLDAIAAAMYPYVVQIQQIVGKKYREASPVLQRDLPAQKKDNERGNQAEFTVSATDFPDWTIVYKKPPADNDNERINVSVSSSLVSQEGTKKLHSEMRDRWNAYDNLRNERTSELSIIAYYKGNRYLTNIADVKNISTQSFDRFNSLNHALDATGNFTDMANWFFVREFQ